MTLDKEAARQRTALLKELRSQHADTIESTREYLKAQKAVRRQICQMIRSEPKTVPEIAAATELPAHEVLWQITAMKKYDLVTEAGQCGEYYLYQMAEEAK